MFKKAEYAIARLFCSLLQVLRDKHQINPLTPELISFSYFIHLACEF